MSITFFAEGIPTPQGSKIVRRHGDKAWLADVNSKALKSWRENVKQKAQEVMGERSPFDCALEVTATFFLPRPSSVTRDLPNVKPDLDKLLRGLLDSLTPCMVNDSRVCVVTCDKQYADFDKSPGVQVQIKEINNV